MNTLKASGIRDPIGSAVYRTRHHWADNASRSKNSVFTNAPIALEITAKPQAKDSTTALLAVASISGRNRSDAC